MLEVSVTKGGDEVAEKDIAEKTLEGYNGNHGDRNGGHLIGYGGLISVPVVQ